MSAMTTEPTALLRRAESGDGAAFDELVAPYRRELQVHCYRMLGSFQDAEDALQDTLLSAWQGLAGFEGRSSVRTWLYRIATNRCLNARRSASRRSAKEWNVPGVEPPAPTRLGEVFWLEPFPDALLEGVLDASPPGPEARYEQSEAVSLAFVTALQVLPPRQVAVLLLRDVLGYHAAEVADMLDTTTESVSSALKRARAGLERRRPTATSASTEENALAAKFATAYEAADIEAVIALLTDDVFTSMPPMPFEYQGRAATVAFLSSILDSGRRHQLVPTRANGQPAFGAYLRGSGEVSHGVGLFVLEVRDGGISALTRFESGALPWFGLPRSIPAVRE
ncbi:RNA polymerase sigma-70 factor (TIGR02960 family) [Catenulispora sp. GP43]|uniref:sigma-70 family RNA polymerase sigma factor n=1 Tax=Catenulispora sp. GP43 TaxID=3156263 RepID=UPI00351241C5